jgi:hypothetical protein
MTAEVPAEPATQFSFRRNRNVSGIGGWLALLLVLLCAKLLISFIELATDYGPGFDIGWSAHPESRLGLAISMGIMILHLGVNLWSISALIQKKRSFRTAFVVFWVFSVLYPLSLLGMLVVPDVTLDDVFDPRDVVTAASVAIGQGLWFLYICLSVRVRNTLVN